MNFFGRPTPFIRGPERGAAAGNLTVIFGQIHKVKRGHYKLTYELCTSDSSSLPRGEITRRYVRYLEKSIREHPEMWLMESPQVEKRMETRIQQVVDR
jgi:KDO2-lipid IV(A) lauroyltransferase